MISIYGCLSQFTQDDLLDFKEFGFINCFEELPNSAIDALHTWGSEYLEECANDLWEERVRTYCAGV